jgi:hypothetical protein
MQMDSLGEGRFNTLAPKVLHHLAPVVQQPLMRARSAVFGPEEAMSSNYRPLTSLTRHIYKGLKSSVDPSGYDADDEGDDD